jgi:AraC-like DNA-binding protein
LVELVSTFYHARVPVRDFDETERADRAQLRFQLAGHGEYRFSDGKAYRETAATLIGPTSAPVRSVATGPIEMFGCGLMPAGWGALMGHDAGRYANAAVDGSLLFGDQTEAIVAELRAAPTTAEKLAIGNRRMRALFAQRPAPPFWFTRLVDQWLTDNPSPSVEALVTASGLKLRSLERKTKRFYGVPPKTLARKYRALRAATALARGDDIAAIIALGAFYDQSHLIREVKQFVGFTPGQLLDPSPLTRATTGGRKELAGLVSPLITDT